MVPILILLAPDTSYTLYVFSHPIFNNGTENVSFSYDGQSGTVVGTGTGDSLATFTFTTGAAVADSIFFSGSAGTVGTPADFPSVTGFAIVEAVPEPSTWAMLFCGMGVLVLCGYRKRI